MVEKPFATMELMQTNIAMGVSWVNVQPDGVLVGVYAKHVQRKFLLSVKEGSTHPANMNTIVDISQSGAQLKNDTGEPIL